MSAVEKAIMDSREALKNEVLSCNNDRVLSISNANAVADVQYKRPINRRKWSQIKNKYAKNVNIDDPVSRKAILRRLHEVGHESANKLVARTRQLQLDWPNIHHEDAAIKLLLAGAQAV